LQIASGAHLLSRAPAIESLEVWLKAVHKSGYSSLLDLYGF